ncbi:MAG TPA: M23 family metallopeptidase [Candidatus Paceibacterota bacterium]|nr:M23 family metallopeptidase [Candidatus Paceibacterota bacterium]
MGAFWPFTVSRAQETTSADYYENGVIAYLDAATHSDPNPGKGEASLAMTGDSALLANIGPDGVIAERGSLAAKSGGGQITSYTVEEGDSLSEIADRFGVTVNTILWANDISDANTVRPGDDLLILPVSGLQYTVRSGDTIGTIADKYGADANEIALFNGLASSVDLKAGSDIIIPGGQLPSSKSATAKKPTAKKPVSSGSTAPKTLPAISGFFGNPLPGGKITQGIHGYNGIDIGAPSGTPIYAAASGSIVVAKNDDGYNGGYGNYIVIDHGNGTQTLYAHMSSTAVSGGSVSKGDVIGYVGSTGRSTGNHLHFEVRGAKNPLAN